MALRLFVALVLILLVEIPDALRVRLGHIAPVLAIQFLSSVLLAHIH